MGTNTTQIPVKRRYQKELSQIKNQNENCVIIDWFSASTNVFEPTALIEYLGLDIKSFIHTYIVCGTAEAARRAKKAVSSVYSGTVKGINGTRKLVSRVNQLRNAPITSKNVRRFAGRVIKSGMLSRFFPNIMTTGKNTLMKLLVLKLQEDFFDECC